MRRTLSWLLSAGSHKRCLWVRVWFGSLSSSTAVLEPVHGPMFHSKLLSDADENIAVGLSGAATLWAGRRGVWMLSLYPSGRRPEPHTYIYIY